VGFRWQGAGVDPRLICVTGAAFDPYRPHPGIFRDFAELEPTLEAVVSVLKERSGLGIECCLDFSLIRDACATLA
jgi:hypothetical protein